MMGCNGFLHSFSDIAPDAGGDAVEFALQPRVERQHSVVVEQPEFLQVCCARQDTSITSGLSASPWASPACCSLSPAATSGDGSRRRRWAWA